MDATHPPPPRANAARPSWFAREGVLFAVVALVHLVVAMAYKVWAGVTIVPGAGFDWDRSWHLMPLDLLRFDLLNTIWDLHAQPPLFNLWCGLFAKTCYPDHIAAMHVPQILLGALICGMVYSLLRQGLGRRGPAFGLAMALALNPSLMLFEASLGYEILTAFWATLAVFLVALFGQKNRPALLYGFVLALNLLLHTRSLYHLVLLAVLLPFAAVLAGARWRRVLVVGLLIGLLSVAWYGKNAARFGTFSASSWSGQNLWTIVSANYDRQDLEGFIDEGVLKQTVLDVLVWHRPDAYRSHGFDAESDRPALSRNNYNNINMVGISRMYARNARRLMLHRPFHYVVNVAKAFRIFCLPTSRTKYVQENAARMGWHEAVFSQVLQGQFFTRRLGKLVGKDPFLSFWFFVIPAVLLAYAVRLCRRCGMSPKAWADSLRAEPALALTAILIAYTVVVACTCDYGENGRFKFAIEPLLWPFVMIIAFRTSRRSR